MEPNHQYNCLEFMELGNHVSSDLDFRIQTMMCTITKDFHLSAELPWGVVAASV